MRESSGNKLHDAFKRIALRDPCPIALAEQIGMLSHQFTTYSDLEGFIFGYIHDHTANVAPMMVGSVEDGLSDAYGSGRGCPTPSCTCKATDAWIWVQRFVPVGTTEFGLPKIF